MGLNDALTAKREAVLERWLQAVLATYPEETAKFLSGSGDAFANPVGHTLRDGLRRLYDGLAAGAPPPDSTAAVDGIVRIRAVQEFKPSEAVGFIYALKGILREELADCGAGDLATLDGGVDALALVAFDVYMQCREKLFEIRVREIKERQLLAARCG